VSVTGDAACSEHDNAAMQIVADVAGSSGRANVLPAALADSLLAAMEAAVPLIKRTVESGWLPARRCGSPTEAPSRLT
jgi:hypothetical protein